MTAVTPTTVRVSFSAALPSGDYAVYVYPSAEDVDGVAIMALMVNGSIYLTALLFF